jgi:hypothetical protein
MNEGWAGQCGTTLDPEKAYYKSALLEDVPLIKDGYLYTADNELFTLVHQYDRIPEWNEIITKKFDK